MGIEANTRKKSAQDIMKLLEQETPIEKIYLKMLLRYGIGKVTVKHIIDTIREGLDLEKEEEKRGGVGVGGVL